MRTTLRKRKKPDNRWKGYIDKDVKTIMDEMQSTQRQRWLIRTQIILKRTKDILNIDRKVISMYTKGMSQRVIKG